MMEEKSPEQLEAEAKGAQHHEATIWLQDGNSWVGIFENKNRESKDLGFRFALPFSLDDAPLSEVQVNHTRCPPIKKIPNPGQCVLIAIARTPDDVVREMFWVDPAPEAKPDLSAA
jgi:hypothetical protein